MDIVDFLRRNWQALYPPRPAKTDNALRFGILGAANIAPSGLIRPAASHPEVIVQAVAARDRKKAEAFALKHGIPQVLDNYTALINDPTLDAVYIALPNGLHFEWTLKALAKGKHVLLEKPAVSNSTEAELLFKSPLLTTAVEGGGGPPVLLEAFHYRFQPGWQYFLTLVDRPSLETVHAECLVPNIFAKDDIRFRYELAGGGMMDLGTYAFSTLRQIFNAEPEVCLECSAKKCAPPFDLCDEGSTTRFQFPGGKVATTTTSLKGGILATLATGLPWVRVTHKPVPAPEAAAAEAKVVLKNGQECVVTRTLTFNNFMLNCLWHRIDIEDEYVVRPAGGEGHGANQVVKRWTKKESKKIYTFKDAGIDQPSEPFWMSYRHQLEQFVNRIRGRQGSGAWVSYEDSLLQMRMIDMAYEKAGLPARPTSEYRPA